MASIAYGIFAFKDPELVARLVNRLQTDSDFTYVHFDASIGEQRFRNWKRLIEKKCPNKNIEIVSVFRSKYMSFGQVESILSSMKYFDNFNYDYYINLSSSCYPLKSTVIIKEEFDHQDSIFMEVFEMPFKGWFQGGMFRLESRFYFFPRGKYPYVRLFRIPRLKKELPYGLKPYGGSCWFCLPKEVVRYILDFVEQKPEVKKFFRRTACPDEMFFQTILMNSSYRSRIVNDNKRYIDWRRGIGSSPTILTKDDFEKMKKSNKLFARKFDPDIDEGVLNIIDQHLEETERARATKLPLAQNSKAKPHQLGR